MIWGLLPLLAGLVSLVLGLIVLISGANTKNSKWPFVLFSSSVGVWAIFVGLFTFAENNIWAEFFVTAYYIAALLIAYSFLIFSLNYTGLKVSKVVIYGAIIPWILMTTLILVPDFFILSVETDTNSVGLLGSSYALYALIFLLYVGIGLGYMVVKATSANHHAHAHLLTISLAICMTGGAFFNLILPWAGNYSYIILGPLFSFLMVFSVFYAIARHGLFDVRLAVIRTVTYLLALSTLAGVYLVIAYVIFNQLLGQTSSVQQTFVNVALTLLLAFLFQPIKRFFDRLTNRLFYKDGYDTETFYSSLNKLLSSNSDLRILLEKAAGTIALTLKSEQAFFFVYTGEKSFVTAGTKKHTTLPLKDAETLRDYNELVALDDPQLAKQVYRLMTSHKIRLVMPLLRDDEVMGYLCLGEHKTSTYSLRDRRVLRTVADELVIAIQNALSVKAVKDLNAHLEQRIDAATKELRASNAQLQKLDEAKDEFISIASHQLRTPLTSIKGYISMMMEGDVGKISPQQKKILEEAFISSDRMVRLIGDFLNVSRLQTGKFVIEKHPSDLAQIVQHELESLATNAASRGLTFTYTPPKKFPQLVLDENKMQQVVMNFCDNAIYYSKENSIINVSLKVVKGFAEFTVKDSGIGVPKAQQKELFTKFFRANNARQQRPDGTGVGLFLAKKVIDAHHGELIFKSIENKGSTFGFRLPIERLRAGSDTK